MYYLYNILFYLLIPVELIRLLLRSRRNPAYRQRWGERFAYFNMPSQYKHAIWVHAVSVGEVVAATAIIRALQEKYPNTPIVITTMTPTGSDQVKKTFSDSDNLFHVYVPYDLPTVIKRFLNKVEPKLTLIMETELWPNILYYCHKRNIPVLIANARLSPRSFKKYIKIRSIMKSMFQHITFIATQSKYDSQRYKQLGAKDEQIQMMGNVKFDKAIPEGTREKGQILREQLGVNRLIWIAASTHAGEEEIVLDAFSIIKRERPDSLLFLVPRHPNRADAVASLCTDRKYSFITRSSGESCTENTDIFIGNTLGELMTFYAASDVALVAGSLVPIGGHDILEPARLSLPIIVGQYMGNSPEVVDLFQKEDALITVKNAQELADNVLALLTNHTLRNELGQKAQMLAEVNKGAVEKHLRLIEKMIG